MKAFVIVPLALAAALSAPAMSQDARTLVREASKVSGADTVETLQYTATGFDYAIGQQGRTDLPWPKFIEKRYTRAIDFRVPAARVERVRTQGENPPRGGGGQPINGEQTQTQYASGAVSAPWAQQAEFLVTPYGFLRAAATRDVTVETRTVDGKKYQAISFVAPNGAKVAGFLNEAHLVERVETWIDQSVLGDTRYESVYTDYRDVGGTQFPFHIVQRQGGYPIYDLTVSDVQVNKPVSVTAPQPAAPTTTAGSAQKLGEGVWLLAGNYGVIAAEFKDYVVLFESGQSDERAAEVIAAAKQLVPNKPVRYVVNTHPHFDHAGGLRAFVAQDITILTHRSNVAYLRKVLAQPRTLAASGPQPGQHKPKVEGVGDKKVLTDGQQTVELYRLKDFGHHDAMLVAYFPREKVLFEADAYNPQAANATPPSPANPFNISLLDNIDALKLQIDRIVPVHRPQDDRVVTLDELRRWAGRTAVAKIP